MLPSHYDVMKTIPNNNDLAWWKDLGMRKLNFIIVCAIWHRWLVVMMKLLLLISKL